MIFTLHAHKVLLTSYIIQSTLASTTAIGGLLIKNKKNILKITSPSLQTVYFRHVCKYPCLDSNLLANTPTSSCMMQARQRSGTSRLWLKKLNWESCLIYVCLRLCVVFRQRAAGRNGVWVNFRMRLRCENTALIELWLILVTVEADVQSLVLSYYGF